MHLADGVVTFPVLAATSALAAAGLATGLSKIGFEDIPKVGLLSASFFVASLIHINIGPASAHLMLVGLLGLLLGWAAFPALAAAYLLQTLFFGYGGITTLGANTLNSGAAAVICFALFHLLLRSTARKISPFWAGFVVGFAGIVLNCFFLALSLYISDKDFLETLIAISVAHVPVAVIEAFVTGSAVSFLQKVKPEMLVGPGFQTCNNSIRHP